MKYVLPTSSLTKYQCNELDKHIAPILLNALSTHRNVSRTVLYSPEQQGGYGIIDIWHLQRGGEMHYRRHDTTGRLFKISLQWLQLEAGVLKPFYTYIYNDIESTLANYWIKHLYEYLDSCKVTLHEISPWVYKAPRKMTSLYKTFSSNLIYLECVWHY